MNEIKVTEINLMGQEGELIMTLHLTHDEVAMLLRYSFVKIAEEADEGKEVDSEIKTMLMNAVNRAGIDPKGE